MSEKEYKWSLGPWIYQPLFKAAIIAEDGETVVHDEYGILEPGNANLIKSAPDLYEALEALLADCDEYVKINNLHSDDGTPASNYASRAARAALAKARGE